MGRQDELYEAAEAEFGQALERLARGYEADPDKRRDLLQEIYFALWKSFAAFYIFAGSLNKKKARELQEQIDALGRAQG